ncbi:3-oxoacyl-ACP synthase III family protein [Nocardia tengchongensis]|uniref:3-oxoacyl-ACP synthase III family protein n=1 Tax=Nocardia tengchongensis TaxID=2055889 RepID=UPI0036743027
MTRIIGFGECLPGQPVTNAELAAMFGLHERWLDTMTGNHSRYYCAKDAASGVPTGTGDLAVAAGAAALADAATRREDIDFVILATASPDELMPATVNRVIDRLGINDVPAIQLTSGCAGAVQALYVADTFLRAGHRRGLVIGADTCKQMWPSGNSAVDMRPAEAINFAMFGDGAGAAVLDGRPGPGLRIDEISVRSVGLGREPGQVVRWYGANGAPTITDDRGVLVREPMASEDYKSIESEVPRAAQLVIDELLDRTGWSLPEVDLVLTPQLNGVMTERIRVSLGVREDQAVSCVADTGNNGNALPLIQLKRTADRIRLDRNISRRVLVCAIESSKWIQTGMALSYEPESTL